MKYTDITPQQERVLNVMMDELDDARRELNWKGSTLTNAPFYVVMTDLLIRCRKDNPRSHAKHAQYNFRMGTITQFSSADADTLVNAFNAQDGSREGFSKMTTREFNRARLSSRIMALNSTISMIAATSHPHQ